MKLFFALCVGSLALGGTLVASASADAQELDSRETAIQFWGYAECLVKRDEWLVKKILAEPLGSERRRELSVRLASKNKGCLPRGYDAKFSGRMMRSAIAGAYVVHKFKEQSIPDFSYKPTIYPASKLADDISDKRKLEIGLQMFAECVARREFPKVLTLLAAKPYSPEEESALAALQPIMGECLPVSKGTKLGFTRLDMRGRLGSLAYLLVSNTNPDEETESPSA